MKIYRQIIKFLAPCSINGPGHLFMLLFTLLSLLRVDLLIECCVIFGTEQLEESLCKTKVCPNYGRCKIDENGFFAKCVCPTECSAGGSDASSADIDYDLANSVVNLPPSISLNSLRSNRNNKNEKKKKKRLNIKYASSLSLYSDTSQPVADAHELFKHTVCGSNGQDYKNFCELKKHSCRQNRENKIFYFGKCSKLIYSKLKKSSV
jgi:hypothetical protein